MLAGEEVFFRREFGGDAAAMLFTIHHAVVHGHGECGKSGLAGFLALCEQLAKGVDLELGSCFAVGKQQLLHQGGLIFCDLM